MRTPLHPQALQGLTEKFKDPTNYREASLARNETIDLTAMPWTGPPVSSAETMHGEEHNRNDTGEAMTLQKKQSSNDVPCTGGPTRGHKTRDNVPVEESLPTVQVGQEEIRVNRSLPKRKAPLVKDESLSTSLMTSPSNSPRAVCATNEPSTTTAMTRK